MLPVARLTLLCALALVSSAVGLQVITKVSKGVDEPLPKEYLWYWIKGPRCKLELNVTREVCERTAPPGYIYIHRVKVEVIDRVAADVYISNYMGTPESGLSLVRVARQSDAPCDGRAAVYLWALCKDHPIPYAHYPIDSE